MTYELKPGEVRDSAGVVKAHPVGERTPNGTIVARFAEFRPPPPPGLMLNSAFPPVPQRMTIYHKVSGATLMYTVDANAAVAKHPAEWSFNPWPTQASK
jgi:hypothetical protein